MWKRRTVGRWLGEQLYEALDEVVVMLTIAAPRSLVRLVRSTLPGFIADPKLLALVLLSMAVALLVVVVFVWRRRAQFVRQRRRRPEEELEAAVARLFTGRAEALDAFRQLLATEQPERHIVAVHGVGGVGKSWLLCMYRQMCRKGSIPVALVSGDEARSALDVLRTFSHQLYDQDVALSNFEAELERYRRIQAKVQKKTEAWSAMTKVAVEGGKALPMVGPTIGALGVEGVEQMVSLLRSFLAHDEVELHLDPEAALTERFLEDLGVLPESQRLVLMFDTYEQMEGMDDWVRRLVGKLGGRTLVVIAGRTALKGEWLNLRPLIEPIELVELDEEEARACLERYRQEYLRRPLRAEVAEGVIRFAEGLPLALSWSVYLMQQYEAVEFAVVRREVIGNLIDTMTREVEEGWRPILEACAVVRWFNEDTLRSMLKREDCTPLYEELRHFPFVRPRPEGLALHDRVRDWMNEDLVARAPERWGGLNERAAKFYEERLAKIEAAGEKFGEEWQQLIAEKLYHRVRVDDNVGLKLLKELFEEAQLRYPKRKSIRILLLESAKTDSRFADRKSRWVRYYEARLNDDPDEKAEALKGLISETDLELFARTSLGIALFEKDEVDQVIDVLEKNLKFLEPAVYEELSPIDRATARGSCRYLGTMYKMKGRHEDAIKTLELYGDPPALAEAARSRFFQGRFDEAVSLYLRSLKMLRASDAPVRYEARYRRQLGHVYQSQGRYEEAQIEFERSKVVAETTENRFDAEVARCNLAITAQDITVLKSAVDYLTGNLHLFVGHKSTVSWYVTELARLRLKKGDYDKAHQSFQEALDLARMGKYNIGILRSLLGLCNLYYARGTPADIPPLAENVECLSLQYKCWDQLARLRVVQGNLLADEASVLADGDERQGGLLKEAFGRYSEAMLYALRYNRYLLDEVADQIIVKCRERGEQGKEILEGLIEYWESGTLEGKRSVELEEEGRRREVGDGKPQVRVRQRLERALRGL